MAITKIIQVILLMSLHQIVLKVKHSHFIFLLIGVSHGPSPMMQWTILCLNSVSRSFSLTSGSSRHSCDETETANAARMMTEEERSSIVHNGLNVDPAVAPLK